MKRVPKQIRKNHLKLPKWLFWWESNKPVFVYYRAIDSKGHILIEDRSPYETVGRTLDEKVDHFERIECYQITLGWRRWKPSKRLLNDPETTMWAETINEED